MTNFHPRHQIHPDTGDQYSQRIAQTGFEILWFVLFVIIAGFVVWAMDISGIIDLKQ